MKLFSIARHFARNPPRRFADDAKGGVYIIFGLALVPLLMFIGVAIDYTRAAQHREVLQAALDSTALSLAHEPINTPYSQMMAKANRVFAANFRDTAGPVPRLRLAISRPRLTVSANSSIVTSLSALAGQKHIEVSGTSQVLFGNARLEVALALDNTGSMSQNGKIGALKSSVNNLITTLEKATRNAGDTKMSIVPFNTQVTIPTSFKNALWMRYDTAIENVNFHGTSPLPPTVATWTGCVADRDQAYDTLSDAPFSPASNYVAANCEFPGLAPSRTLTTDLESVRAVANAMTPGGATNVTIGLATAMATLRPEHPFGASAQAGPDILKFLILLTDGNNTENRFVGSGIDFNPDAPAIDDRLRQACVAAKTQPVTIFAIRVMDGNEALLRDCASSPKNYFSITNASQLTGVFDQIAGEIAYSRIRLMK